MKPFLGIDITEDRKNDIFNGEEFLVSNASEQASQALDESLEQAGDVEATAKLPTLLRVIQYVCAIAWMLIAVGLIKGMREVDLKTAYANSPELFWVCGGCFIVWGVLYLAARSRARSVKESAEAEKAQHDLDNVSQEILTELNVPDNAVTVDILSFCYKLKKGEPVVKTRGIAFSSHTNFEYFAYVQDQKLYLANLESKYAFSFSELKGIATIDKRITMPEWNKEIPPNVGPYRQYKLTVDNYRSIHVKGYHILKVLHDDELWGIYFPCYELSTFEKLTGFNAH